MQIQEMARSTVEDNEGCASGVRLRWVGPDSRHPSLPSPSAMVGLEGLAGNQDLDAREQSEIGVVKAIAVDDGACQQSRVEETRSQYLMRRWNEVVKAAPRTQRQKEEIKALVEVEAEMSSVSRGDLADGGACV